MSLPEIPAMRRLTKPFWILLALLFLFEAWLWDALKRIVGRLVAFIPWASIRARIADAVIHLPPVATLFVFLIPVLLLLPVKFLGLWMLAHGHWIGAMGTLGLAKVVSMGVTAFIFDITRPKLLELAWFRATYEHVLVWVQWAHALIDPVKAQIRASFHRRLAPLRKVARRALWLMKPARAGRFSRRLWRIRSRMRLAAGR